MPGSDRPSRDGLRGRSDRPRDDRPRAGRPDGGDPRASAGRHVDEPDVPESVKPNDLDKGARGELRTLSKENADAVARHLVMAGRLVEDDPTEAHRHALAAARRAGRVAVVRESLAITAYATGDFALALRELRTYRRISGSDDQIGLMVDSERGVGRPDRALELGRSVDRATLPLEAQVALAIAMSGARLDLEDPRGALDELERAPVDLRRVHPWSSALYESFAAVHDDLGETAEADRWRHRAERAVELLEQLDEEESTVAVSTEDGPRREDDLAEEDPAEDDPEEGLAEEDLAEDDPAGGAQADPHPAPEDDRVRQDAPVPDDAAAPEGAAEDGADVVREDAADQEVDVSSQEVDVSSQEVDVSSQEIDASSDGAADAEQVPGDDRDGS